MKIDYGYKLFRMDKNGNLHPLYVLSKETVPMNEWVKAHDDAPRDENGKVKGKMRLHYRPGFHIAGSKPEAPQITNQTDCIWCLVEYDATICYDEEAKRNGTNKEGKVIELKAELDRLPENGYYHFRTSWKQNEPWIICDKIKVVKILTADEVKQLCA